MTEFPASTSTFDVQSATEFHVNAPAANRIGSVVGYVGAMIAVSVSFVEYLPVNVNSMYATLPVGQTILNVPIAPDSNERLPSL